MVYVDVDWMNDGVNRRENLWLNQKNDKKNTHDVDVDDA